MQRYVISYSPHKTGKVYWWLGNGIGWSAAMSLEDKRPNNVAQYNFYDATNIRRALGKGKVRKAV